MKELRYTPKCLRQEAAESGSRFTIKHIDFFALGDMGRGKGKLG